MVVTQVESVELNERGKGRDGSLHVEGGHCEPLVVKNSLVIENWGILNIHSIGS